MKILALDLGTHAGIAHNLSGTLEAKTVHLATPKEVTAWGKARLTRRADPRIFRFEKLLREFPKPDVVLWEDVLFSSYTAQVQLWSSFRTVVWLVFGQTCVTECVPVSALKKFATGSGMADKAAMLSAMKRIHPEIPVVGLDDNALDSLWIWLWAKENLGRMKT